MILARTDLVSAAPKKELPDEEASQNVIFLIQYNYHCKAENAGMILKIDFLD
jgi:hypothetical protein